MSNLVLKAIQFAIDKHQGQVRKVSNSPYVTHPIAVSYIVASFKKSKHLDEILAACHLHDTLEDTDTTFMELVQNFTPLVAVLVHELTSDENEIAKIGKVQYLKYKMLGISSYGLVIKLADRLHNVSDNPTQKMKDDTREILDYIKRKRKLSRTHKLIVTEIEAHMKVKSFEEFWADEIALIPKRYHDSTLMGILKLLAERAWKQSRYTSDNADRG